jgi:predicted transcriptional regulator
MQMQGIKSDLFALIEQTNDMKVLEAIRVLLQANAGERDFWDQLPDFQKKSIEKGLAQVEQENTIAHEEVMKKYDKWLTK